MLAATRRGVTAAWIFRPRRRIPFCSPGRLASFALVEHQTANKATVVKLMIDGKGQMSCFNVMADPDSGNRCGDFRDALKLDKRDPGRVAGALDWSGEGESLKLAFDLAVSGTAR